MKPEDIKKHYGSNYRFSKETGYAPNTLRYWIRLGYVPEEAQYKMERITNGLFKTQWTKT